MATTAAEIIGDGERLRVRAPAPEWFRWALGRPVESAYVEVEGCPIHYLFWPADAPPSASPVSSSSMAAARTPTGGVS